MLLLFAGSDYYPEGGWSDFIKVVGSLNELEIREERKADEVPARKHSNALESSTETWWETPAHTSVAVTRHINVRDAHGDEYDWWHVVDTETMGVVAEGSTDQPEYESPEPEAIKHVEPRKW